MVFNAIYNILDISLRSVLLVEETGVLHYLQGSMFYSNLINFHEYLIQHALKSGGTKNHFRRVKVPSTLSERHAGIINLFTHTVGLLL